MTTTTSTSIADFPAGTTARLWAVVREGLAEYGRQCHGDLLIDTLTPATSQPASAQTRPVVPTARAVPAATYTLKGVSKTFAAREARVDALADVELEIRAGEIFGIIGRSGAGKSTLLRTLNLLETPTRGAVDFEGRDLTRLSAPELREVRQRIGMVFQHFNLLSSRTVAENVALPLELAGVPRSAIAERVDELLDLVGLSAARDRYPAQISGGQKQRVGIARALANRPAVLLCDEATSALDPETTLSILDLLRDIQRRLGLTVVVVTHQMQVIKALADRVAVMEGGRIIELGNVIDVFAHPQQDTTRALLREVVGGDLPDGVRRRVATLLTGLPAPLTGRLWRITLRGEVVDTPLLAELSTRLPVTAHVLHGYIDEVAGTPFAALLVTITGARDAIDQAAAHVRARGGRIEELQP